MQWPPEGRTRVLAAVAAIALMVPLGSAAIAFAPPGTQVAPYWPNAAVAVLAVGLAAPRWRPAAVAAAVGALLVANLVGGRPLDIAIAFSVIVAAEGVVVWRLLTPGGRAWPELRTTADLSRFLVAAGCGALLAGGAAGASAGLLNGADVLVTAQAVTASHAAALLVGLPLAMTLSHRGQMAGTRETVAVLVVLVAAGVAVFAGDQSYPLPFACLPPLVWAALRLSPRLVMATLLGFGALVSGMTSAGYGPFVEAVRDSGAAPEVIGTLLQSFLGVSALITIPAVLLRVQRLATIDELRESRDLVRGILDAAAITAILGLDHEGRVAFANRGAERLMGRRADEVVGHAATRLVPGQGRPRLRMDTHGTSDPMFAVLVESVLANGSGRMDCDLVGQEDEVRTVSLTLSRRHGPDGSPVGYLLVGDDVTERRRQEAALSAALEAERDSVERLAQADAAKNDFLATMSHELRTPITSVLGYAQLLLSDDQGGLPHMHRQIVGRIERNGRRLLALIEDLLLMSQVEAGDLRLHRRPTDLRDAVGLAARVLEPAFAIGGRELQVTLPDSPVEAVVDADRVERAVAALLDNAMKYSQPGDPVRLTLRVEEGDAIVTVTDSGHGIGAEERARVFDRFYRGSHANVHAIQGAGLGLTVAHAIVTGHGGRVDVQSEVGVGSTFTLWLPLGVSAPPVVGNQRSAEPVAGEPEAPERTSERAL